MALVVKDRVRETTTTTGTGTLTLAGAAAGFQSFSVIGDGNTTYYAITDGTSWEVGIGTYTASGSLLSRDTILESSNSGNAVDFIAGTKDVFITYPAERSVYVDGNSIVPAAVAAKLEAANGGTGQTSYAVGDVLYASGTTALSKRSIGTAGQVMQVNSGATAPEWVNSSGTGDVARTTNPVFTTPNLGTPSAATLTNATGLPLSTGVTGTLPAANGGTGQSSYAVGDLLYATGTTSISKLGIGASTTILTSSGTAPQWTAASSVAIGTATNLAGGAAGSVPYQSGAATTTFLGIGAANTVMTSSGTAPQWSTALTGLTGVSTTTATLSGNLTLSGGTANGVLYLDGSKVATSGSALTFDGTNVFSLSLTGVQSTSRVLASAGQTATLQIGGNANSGGATSLDIVQDGSSNGYVFQRANAPLIFGVNNSEQMRLTSTGLGIGTSSPLFKLDVQGASGLAFRLLETSTGNNNRILISQSGTETIYNSTYSTGSASQVWQLGTAEQMRLTSTGLGIGGTPTAKLEVAGSFTITADVSATTTIGRFGAGYPWSLVRPSSTATGIEFRDFPGNALYQLDQTSGNQKHIWYTGGTERMRLDSSGNLGLGVTPSAWSLPSVQSQFGIFAGQSEFNTASNAYFDGAWKYFANGYASRYSHASGIHYWFNSGPGTAGNAISFTQAMTLDASGNLLVGTTTSTGKRLTLAGSADLSMINTANTSGFDIGLLGGSSDATAYIYQRANSAMVFGTNNTERARIDSSGNLGIGTSSPGARLDVQAPEGRVILTATTGTNASYYTAVNTGGSFFIGRDNSSGGLSGTAYSAALISTGAYPMVFGTNSAEKMRLDSSGNLGLGVTPSTWTLGKAFQVNSLDGAVVWGYAGAAQFGNNFYYNGGYLYATTAAATRYVQGSGAHQWYTAPSGTAGNAISFTQAMTLDASGNLLVGTTSNTEGAKLNVQNGYVFVKESGGGDLYIRSGVGAGVDPAIQVASNDPLLFYTNNSERARIPAAGGMVVGTAALATTATDGFLYVPTCAGTPTGTPTTQTGTAPIVVDTTNNKLYFYSGGQWRDAGP